MLQLILCINFCRYGDRCVLYNYKFKINICTRVTVKYAMFFLFYFFFFMLITFKSNIFSTNISNNFFLFSEHEFCNYSASKIAASSIAASLKGLYWHQHTNISIDELLDKLTNFTGVDQVRFYC